MLKRRTREKALHQRIQIGPNVRGPKAVAAEQGMRMNNSRVETGVRLGISEAVHPLANFRRVERSSAGVSEGSSEGSAVVQNKDFMLAFGEGQDQSPEKGPFPICVRQRRSFKAATRAIKALPESSSGTWCWLQEGPIQPTFRSDPTQIQMLLGLDLTLPVLHLKEQEEDSCFSVSVGAGELERANFGFDAKLFFELSSQSLFGAFSKFNFTAGKLPGAGET